jgi:thiamine biosynthesis protein ThiI
VREVILVKCGELVLKGLNRRSFEDVLIKNLKRALKPLGRVEFFPAQSTIELKPLDEAFDFEAAEAAVARAFGIVGYSRCAVVEKDMQQILPVAAEYLKDELESTATFKVEAKRSDKKFPLTSPEICRTAGDYLIEQYPHLAVDVHKPQLTVHIEVRDKLAYIHGGARAGAGGLPVGTGGRAAVMISGGIDSPVASWMMSKRGVALTAIHFASPPYTSQRAEDKVAELLRRVSLYAGSIKLIVVPFTKIQEEIKDLCNEDYFTIIMRRYMMRIAQRIARQENCEALITGESVGQVASQTMKALACTDIIAEMPVFRPLIGMDKDEIITISRKIDTFETSILPYEDCCTVFTPKHPKTKPNLPAVEAEEEKLSLEAELEKAVAEAKVVWI